MKEIENYFRTEMLSSLISFARCDAVMGGTRVPVDGLLYKSINVVVDPQT